MKFVTYFVTAAEKMPFMIVQKAAWTSFKCHDLIHKLKLPVSNVLFAFTAKDYSKPWAKESPGPRPDYRQCIKELEFLLKGDIGLYKDIRYK